MFLTIQLVHLTCRKDHIQSPTIKIRMRLVPKNKWRQFKIHSKNPKWRMMTRMRCHRLEGNSVVSSIWIYKIQHVVDGNIVGYKARFVAWGFSWKEGLEYEETFAVSKSWNTYMMILMKILTFATRLKMQVYTLDGHIEY